MPVIFAGLEGLEQDRAVAVVVDDDAIEIPMAALDREVRRPVILDPLIDDLAAAIDRAQPVRAAAERGLEERLADIAIGDRRPRFTEREK